MFVTALSEKKLGEFSILFIETPNLKLIVDLSVVMTSTNSIGQVN